MGVDAPASDHAEAVGLVLSDDAEPGITRRRRGRGWSFHGPDGELLRDEARERCLALAIPPAWTDVWICPEEHGHLQAVGRDEAGRKQYRYHDDWRHLREAAKFAGLATFADALPRVRSRIDEDLRRRDLGPERVLALALAVLDATLMRIGHAEYAGEDGARGLTTIEPEHVDVGATVVEFRFPGKSGVEQELTLRDRRLARQLLRIQDEVDDDGVDLFAWRDGDDWRDVRAADVNDHLRALAGVDVTAKDFRTWGGSVVALARLSGEPPAADDHSRRSQQLDAVDLAAARLGNTRAVARASYVHPLILERHDEGGLEDLYDDEMGIVDHLDRHERAMRRLLAS